MTTTISPRAGGAAQLSFGARLRRLALRMAASTLPFTALAQETPPNVIVIMGDYIGWSNIGVCNMGAVKTQIEAAIAAHNFGK